MSVSVSKPRLAVLSAACLAALASSSFWTAAAHAQDAGSATVAPAQLESYEFNIAPGPLNEVLGRFGEQAQVMVGGASELTSGVSSNGIKGRHTAPEALRIILQGSGLEALPATGGYRLRRYADASSQGGMQLSPVQVVGESPTDKAFRTPAAVSVITREQIDRMPPRNTGDLLAETPGVYSASSRANPGLSVNIRGMQDFGRVNVMIDGTRQNFQVSGHGANGQVYIDPALLSGVDVAKGPVSTVGGAAMLGGVVNFHTLDANDLIKDGQSSGSRVTASTGTNAYHFSGSGATGLRVNQDLDLVFAISRTNTGAYEYGTRGLEKLKQQATLESYTQLAGQDQWSGLAKATWRPGAGHEIKLTYIGLDTDFLTESVGVSERNKLRSDTLLLNHTYDALGGNKLASSLYYTQTKNKIAREATSNADNFNLQYQTNTIGGTTQLDVPLRLGSMEGVIKTGGEFFHDWTDPKAQTSGEGSARWFTGPTPKGDRTVASIFTEATLEPVPWFQAIGGLRYNWYTLSGKGEIFSGTLNNPLGVRPQQTDYYTNFETKRHASSFAPKLTLSLKPVEQWQVYASGGYSTRPPGLTETLMGGAHTGNTLAYFPNPTLKEERARTWEVGTNLMFDGLLTSRDKLRMKATWFNNRVKNYTTLAPITKPTDTYRVNGLQGSGSWSYVNLQDPFRSKGLELTLDYDAKVAFATINYTHLLSDPGKGGYDPFPLGSVTGFPAAASINGRSGDSNLWYMLPPRKSLAISGGVRLLEQKLELGARFRLNSPAKNNSLLFTAGDGLNGNGRLTTSHTWDLWASYEPTSNVTLRLSVENLMNQAYTEMNDSNYYLAPGRTVIGSISYRF